MRFFAAVLTLVKHTTIVFAKIQCVRKVGVQNIYHSSVTNLLFKIKLELK
jgi:hypothetical protein